MANPTTDAIAAIRGRVADWTQTDEQIRDTLNARDTANPTAQTQVPKVLSMVDLMGRLTPEARAAVSDIPGLVRIIDDVAAQDREGVGNWLQISLDRGAITQAQFNDIAANELQATVPDPAWPPLLSWAEITLGRFVDTDDIQTARP